MGTRAWTMHWWTIGYDNLVSLCDEAVRRVESHADFMPDETWYRIASDDCTSRGLMAEVRRLQHAFATATNGLELEFLAYDEDMDITHGRHVDPWEGCIFGVRGVTDFTPAGKALEPLLVESGWVDAG